MPARQQGHQGAAEARQQTKSIYRGVEVGGVQRLVVNGGTMVPPPVPAQRRPNLRLARGSPHGAGLSSPAPLGTYTRSLSSSLLEESVCTPQKVSEGSFPFGRLLEPQKPLLGSAEVGLHWPARRFGTARCPSDGLVDRPVASNLLPDARWLLPQHGWNALLGKTVRNTIRWHRARDHRRLEY